MSDWSSLLRTEGLREKVRVGQATFGLGVFAMRQFRAGAMIARVDGTLMHDAGYESDYCIEIGAETSLEPEPPFRYLNHSCRPNCILVQVECPDMEGSWEPPELWVDTIAAVEPGEELTIDYAWPAEVAIPCGCGSPCCRGWIAAEEELHRLTPIDAPRRSTGFQPMDGQHRQDACTTSAP